ncbi:MAG: hypothetical protein CMC45_03385 [Flavobacteriaceae bacterium]|nr:hypothetical protein [Flavobacteriaceae bacterium]
MVTASIYGSSNLDEFEDVKVETKDSCKCIDFELTTGLELEKLTFDNIRINNSEYYNLSEEIKLIVIKSVLENQDKPLRIFGNFKSEWVLAKNNKVKKKIISFRGENNISKLNLMSTNFYLFNNSEVKSVNFTIDTKTNFRTNYQVFVPKLSKKIEVIINRKIKKSFGEVQYKFDIK